MDLLLEHGALDVFHAHSYEKPKCHSINGFNNNRGKEYFTELLFKHTSTIGMRFQTMERSVMDRSFKILETPFGKVHIKKSLSWPIERVY